MRDILLVLLVCVVVYGIWYAVNPMASLRRKYRGEEVPKTAIQTARIAGAVIAVLGAAVLIFLLVQGDPAA